ncbi:hypothetical protein BV898_18324 [Hypsibius exemplaris]|uniref:Sushi domain-containing protein n=1 Tax=Hypsibius exemplaris TaxID=2072580 RepID=A0A9X6NHC8_HYPEX|nr:hypothetical protein BV898_18324 [Hypsibius exemplaris]
MDRVHLSPWGNDRDIARIALCAGKKRHYRVPDAEGEVDMGDVFTYFRSMLPFFSTRNPTPGTTLSSYCQRRGAAQLSRFCGHRFSGFQTPHQFRFEPSAVQLRDSHQATSNGLQSLRDSSMQIRGLACGARPAATTSQLGLRFTVQANLNRAVQLDRRMPTRVVLVVSPSLHGLLALVDLYLRGPSLRWLFNQTANGATSAGSAPWHGCGIPTHPSKTVMLLQSHSVGAVANIPAKPRLQADSGRPRPRVTRSGTGMWSLQQCTALNWNYHCEEGYSLVGNSDLLASGDEVWAGEIPFCQLGGDNGIPAGFFGQSQTVGTFGVTPDASMQKRRTKSTTRLTTAPTTSSSTTATTASTTTLTTTATTTTTTATTPKPTSPTTTPTTTTTTPTTTTPTTTTPTTTTPTTTTTTPTTTTTTTTTTPTTTTTTTAAPTTTTTEEKTTVTSTSQARSSPTSRWIASTYDAFPSTVPDRTTSQDTPSTWMSNAATIETSSVRAIPVGWDTGSSPSTWPVSRPDTSSPQTTLASSSTSSTATAGLLLLQDRVNGSFPTVAPLNGTISFNNSDRALLEGLANEFKVFTSAPAVPEPHKPVITGKFVANNAMLPAPVGGYPYLSSSSSKPTSPTSSSPTFWLDNEGSTGKSSTRAGVGSPYERRLPSVVDNERDGENDVVGRRRLANGVSNVVTATEVILPTMSASKGVGGWIALGVILGLLLLFLLLLLIACLIRRRRSRSNAVELTSNIPVSQYDGDAGTSSAVFSSRYRKAWDNLQVHVEDGGKSGGINGKDTLASHTTFQSTGPRRRDDAKSTGSEVMVNASRAGTMKSVGGMSEAYHGSEEILIDDNQAAPQHLPFNHNAGNNPDFIEPLHSLPRPQAV